MGVPAHICAVGVYSRGNCLCLCLPFVSQNQASLASLVPKGSLSLTQMFTILVMTQLFVAKHWAIGFRVFALVLQSETTTFKSYENKADAHAHCAWAVCAYRTTGCGSPQTRQVLRFHAFFVGKKDFLRMKAKKEMFQSVRKSTYAKSV